MKLTQREAQVVAGICDGLTNAEIGARLFLSRYTIAEHVLQACRKLGARNRAHLVALALRSGEATFDPGDASQMKHSWPVAR